mmetsp:Transcript_154006/g.271963  ORF Transcript_154006/g.271963 Transcript_154006/m.271963 type:complete len:86 (+) Transcript_154006:128-385(+)
MFFHKQKGATGILLATSTREQKVPCGFGSPQGKLAKPRHVDDMRLLPSCSQATGGGTLSDSHLMGYVISHLSALPFFCFSSGVIA